MQVYGLFDDLGELRYIGKKRDPFSEQARANIAAAKIGQKFSDEHKANIRLASIAYGNLAEVRARRSLAAKAQWAARRAS